MRRVSPLLLAAFLACGGSPDRGDPEPDACALDAAGAPWLAFTSRRTGDYDLWTARADGSCLSQVTDDPAADLFPSWSGTTIAFASERGGKLGLWTHDLATGVETSVATGGLESATSPAFSPDGAWIAFEGRAAGAAGAEVYLVPSGGGVPVTLEAAPAGGAGPAWSPDGATIYFVSTRSGSYDVWAAPAGGGDAFRVTTRSRIVGKPAVATDGASLVYARTIAGASTTEIVRQDLATGSITAISNLDDSEPAISGDGQRLALRSFRGGHADVIVEAIDGSGPLFLTSDEPSDGAPAFARMQQP